MTLPMFGDDVLQQMAVLSADNMTARAEVRSAVSVNTGGRVTTTYVPRLLAVPCRVASIGTQERERLMADADEGAEFAALFFPAGTIIEYSDRIAVAGETRQLDSYDPHWWTRLYDVVSITGRSAAVEVHRHVIAREVK